MQLEPTNDPKPLWQRLLPTENPDWFARVLMSIVAAAVLSGLAMLVLGVVDSVSRGRPISYTQPDGRVVTYTVNTVDEEIIAIALAIAGVIWCLVLPGIWRGFHRFRTGLKTLFQTVAIWVCVIPACVVIDRVSRQEELWISAVILLASAGTLLVCARAYAAIRAGKPVVNTLGEVDVRCPKCGYSLIGLGESRCPECGTQYTLDELIRLQGYSKSPGSAAPPPLRVTPPPSDLSLSRGR